MAGQLSNIVCDLNKFIITIIKPRLPFIAIILHIIIHHGAVEYYQLATTGYRLQLFS